MLLQYRYRLVSLIVSFQGPPRGVGRGRGRPPSKYQEGPKPSMAPPHILDKIRQVAVDTVAPPPNVKQFIYLCIYVVGGPPIYHLTLWDTQPENHCPTPLGRGRPNTVYLVYFVLISGSRTNISRSRTFGSSIGALASKCKSVY